MDNDEFEHYMELLRLSYTEKPKNTMIELKMILRKLRMISDDSFRTNSFDIDRNLLMDHDEFEHYIELLRLSYTENSKNTMFELKMILRKLRMLSDNSFIIDSFDIDRNLLTTVILIILIGLVGLFHITSFPMYLFGVVFFIAGLLIGLNNKGFGLIFLVSHGGTGFSIMMGSLLEDVFQNPILTDGDSFVYFYFGTMILITIIAVGIAVLRNISDSLRENPLFVHLPLLLFLIVCLLAGIMPYILPYL